VPEGLAERLKLEKRNPLWLLLLFVFVGFAIATIASLVSIAPGYGIVVIAGLVLLAPPLLLLFAKAAPQAITRIRAIAAQWTWWHLLWFLTYFSMLVFRIRDVQAAGSQPLDAWAWLRILPETFVALSLIVRLVLRRPDWLSTLFRGLMAALAVYCLVCIASTAWSVNASWTIYKSLEFLADVSLIAAIVATAETYVTYKQLLDWTLALYTLSLVGVWINIPIWPNDAFDGGRLTGVFPVEASDSVGTAGAVVALVALCRLFPLMGKARDKALYIAVFLFGMASMILSQTRTAEAVFVIGLGLVMLFSRAFRRFALITTAVLAPFVTASILLSTRAWEKGGQAFLAFYQRNQSQAAIETMSGRTEWWAYGLGQLAHHPLTGMGAYAAARFAVLGKLGVGAASMMHSDWVEILIGTSFWGVIPYMFALLAAAFLLVRCLRSSFFTQEQRQLAMETAALLGMIGAHSFFNDELSWHAPLLYFAILGYAEFVRRQGKPRPQLVPAWTRRSHNPEFATSKYDN
jgi:hypothetical protein